jgi:CRISPR system Cascade subunit CasB
VGSVPEASSVVFPLLPAELRRPWEVNDCWLVATLFSLYPRSARPGKEENLGATLARLDRKKVGGAERHIMAILGAHREDLDAHLRRVVLLARSHEVAIDYHRLLRDLRWWTTDTGNVQRAWSLDFWAGDLSNDPSTTEGAQSP